VTAVRTFTPDEVRELIDPAHLPTVNRWLTRGDGVAIYRNHDLGSRDVGHVKATSYGSPAAQLETDTPPQTLPDIGHSINWRYQLEGVYRGGTL
jgi:hypothetical protein